MSFQSADFKNPFITFHGEPIAGMIMKFTIADWVTFGRIVLSPIVFLLFVFGGTPARYAAFVLFALGAISDTVDGYIARKTKLSDFGKLWDPIADKLLTGFALVALAMMNYLPWWIAIALIARDITVTTIRVLKIKGGGKIILPVFAAKLKTTLEMILIIGLLLWAAVIGKEFSVPMYIGLQIYGAIIVILAWGTGIHYVLKAWRK